MKTLTYKGEKISSASFSDVYELDRMEMDSRFPHLIGRENARVIKVSFPVGVESNENGIKRILDANIVQEKVKQLRDMPIHFADDDAGLPAFHHNGDEMNRPEVGHILDAQLNGNTVIVYAVLHPKTQKKATELIQANKQLLGCSWELVPKKGYYDEAQKTETILDFDWAGLAILSKKSAAYPDSKIMVASKQDKEESKMEGDGKEIKIVLDQKLGEENKILKAKIEADEKAKSDLIRQAEIDKIKSEAEVKTKEAEAKAIKASEELKKLQETIEADKKKLADEKKSQGEVQAKEKAKTRAEELKDFIAGVKEEEKKKIVLTYLEKATDEEYDIFKIGKIKEKAEKKEIITSQGFVGADDKNFRELSEVSEDELRTVYGDRFVPKYQTQK